MGLKSLKSRLILAVSSLVIGSGLLISLLVGQHYYNTLLETMAAQAGSLAQVVALEAADKILINDQVALQKTLDHHLLSHPTIAYLFVLRGDEIVAHSFSEGIPGGLIKANHIVSGREGRIQKIVSTKGEHYLDIAWPVFDGRAGVLRLGFSEGPYRTRANQLWLQMSGLILGILFLALGGTLLFVRRMTLPLAALVRATRDVDRGDLGARVQVKGKDEVATLTSSFNHMVARIEEYTGRLEEQTMELERSHQQTRTFFRVVQEIGALRSLHEIGAYLIGRFQDVLQCSHQMLLLFPNETRSTAFVLTKDEIKAIENPNVVETSLTFIDALKGPTFAERTALGLTLASTGFQDSSRYAVVPLAHGKETFGALLVACREGCECDVKGVDTIGMILNQAAGVIKRAVLHEEEIRDIQRRLDTSSEFSGIIGKDPKMQSIYKLIEDIAPTDATVLIQGESGTGKEMVARAVHQLSTRREKPFVVIDCSAYPATLLESELFGHEKGAFTGATRQKIGRFEQADGGTVFLDEIGEIPPSAQIKLLRVIQTQRFERLGGEKTLTVNVRFIAATNKDLLQEVKAGRFREDLFYRINVIPLRLPPVRERPNDVPLLARHFLRLFGKEQGKDIEDFSPEAMRAILEYSWPGNVRELENSVEHAMVLAKGKRIEAVDLPYAVISVLSRSTKGQPTKLSTMAEKEQELLKETLEKCDWNKKEAARHLGISRNTLYQKMKRYGILKPTAH
jgi:two-component system response regulator HydG